MSDYRFKCPHGWEIIKPWGDGFALRQKDGGLRVVVDCETKEDGREWLHVSASRAKWTPSHEDMALVKRDFIGDERYAYSVWVPTENHVNIHSHYLHLWAMMDSPDGKVLPEFSAVLDGIGRTV